MVHLPEPRLAELLLASIIQTKIILTSILARATNFWPELPLAEWKDTYDTLHMWTQIVGKIRLALTPLVNHWWNATLYVTSRGLTTSVMSYKGRLFQISFDFIAHLLLIEVNDGSTK